ncbi:MAG: hypothetical protein ABIH65_00045 [Nanoarchaeota archaeon]
MNFIFENLNNFVDNNFIEPILIACLLSAMMGYYKSKLTTQIKNRIWKDIVEWILSFVFSLGMVMGLYLIYQIIRLIINQL